MLEAVTNTVKKLRPKKFLDVPSQPVQPLLSLDNPQPATLLGETAMAKKPSEVLSFFLNPSGRYMAHFFHFIGDTPSAVPAKTAGGKAIMNKKGEQKIEFLTKKPRLYLSDVDAIVKRHEELKGKRTYDDIAIGMLNPILIDELEAAKLDVEVVISWAKEEGKAKVSSAPKATKTAKPKVAEEVKLLTGILSGVAANKTPEQMATMLVKMVNNEEWMNAAVARLEEAKSNGRDAKGYIKLRNRK